MDNLGAAEASQPKPSGPYNIERTGDDAYRITTPWLASGEGRELSIEVGGRTPSVKGEKVQQEVGEFLHRGIAARSFCWNAASSLPGIATIVQGARLENGLLHIELKPDPETLKPRRI